jgi:hypothetical protein
MTTDNDAPAIFSPCYICPFLLECTKHQAILEDAKKRDEFHYIRSPGVPFVIHRNGRQGVPMRLWLPGGRVPCEPGHPEYKNLKKLLREEYNGKSAGRPSNGEQHANR